MSKNFASTNSCTACIGSARPGAKALAAYLEDRFPYQASMGIYNCRVVAGTTTLSQHACGRAYDCGVPVINATTANTALGMPIVDLLGEHGLRLGISQLVYDRKIWDRSTPNGRLYKGVHPHYNHIHITLTQQSGELLNYATLVAVLGPADATLPPQEEEMALKNGDGGPAVEWYQKALLGQNPASLPQFGADADFGTETEAAVKAFQKLFLLPETGQIDGITADLLSEYHPSRKQVSTGYTKTEADGRFAPKGAFEGHVKDVVGTTPHQ